jgi:murein DD-endopeptidase MepM/ murein hydrolase activator NlpD
MCKIFKLCQISQCWAILLLAITTQSLALEIKGDFQQGAVIRGKVEAGEKIKFNQRWLSLNEKGEFVFGIGRDAPAKLILITYKNNQPQEHHFVVKKRQYKIQRVSGVPQATVEPSKEQQERIAREAALVGKARKGDLDLSNFMENFKWPVIGPISGVYGSQRVYNNIPGNPHFGVDIAMPVGTPVYAPAGGKVTLVHNDMFLSGGTLIVDHGQGLSSTFIHLSKILVKEGELITQGKKIALVGKTGRASGPHLHWAMNWFTERVDPHLLVGEMPKK